jgi:cytochrome c biogenesis protein CcmG/thiol:disulfide interchange protein DsbE
MAKLSPLVAAPPLVFLALAAVFYVGMYREDPNGIPSTLIGQTAPSLPQDGLADYPKVTEDTLATGEVTLVNFWASWCPPCRAEHPKLLEMSEGGMNIVGINFKDDQDNAVSYLVDDGNPFSAVGFDPKGRTAIDWGVTAPPETFILDGDGKILFRFAGPLVGSDYENRFLPALQNALN